MGKEQPLEIMEEELTKYQQINKEKELVKYLNSLK